MPASASGECTSSERKRSARSSRRYFPSAGSRRYAITAVSWCSVRTSTPSPCISSLARCATSGGPPSPTSAPPRGADRRRRGRDRRRCTRRGRRRSAIATPSRPLRPGDALPPRLERVRARRHRAPRARRAAAAAASRIVSTSTSSVSASGTAAVCPDRLEQPRQQGAERELVEEDAHLLAVARALAQIARARRRQSTVATQQRHLAVQEHPVARISPRFWRCFGGSSSRCSKIPSRSP